MGSLLAAGASGVLPGSRAFVARGAETSADGSHIPPSPRQTRLRIKPVMTNLIHTGVWEGPCRWRRVEVEDEKKHAKASFARFSDDLKQNNLGLDRDQYEVLDPVQVTFDESFNVAAETMARVCPRDEAVDAFFVHPAGSSITSFEIAKRFNKPIVMVGLNCRKVDVAAYTRNQGLEAYVPADQNELGQLAARLRARKVFRNTRVLFPTDRGLPAVCSIGSIADLAALKELHGIEVCKVPFEELAATMEAAQRNPACKQSAEQLAEALVAGADRSFIDRKYVAASGIFYEAVQQLMGTHDCNAFTIECFELCASQLAEQWKITPCLIHSLFRDRGYASSCEADLGALLAMRLLMSLGQRSCHMGNSDPRGEGTFRINHSVPALKMNGFDEPDLDYQLGRFVESGWGTKMVVDFMDNEEKTITVARVDPTARKLLVLRGELVGSSGWDRDHLGCSVEALIRPPEGRLDEFLKKRLEFGNHLPWVYGDYTEQLAELGPMAGLEVDLIA
jgi:hypothetical protein